MDVHTHVSDSISFPPPEPQCTIKVTSFNASGNPQTYQLGVGQKDLSLGQLASRILKEAGVSEQDKAVITLTGYGEGVFQIRVLKDDASTTLGKTVKISEQVLKTLEQAHEEEISARSSLLTATPHPKETAQRTSRASQPMIAKSSQQFSFLDLEEIELPPPPTGYNKSDFTKSSSLSLPKEIPPPSPEKPSQIRNREVVVSPKNDKPDATSLLQSYVLGRDITTYSSNARQVVTEMATVQTDRIFLKNMISHLNKKYKELKQQYELNNTDTTQINLKQLKEQIKKVDRDINYYEKQLLVSEKNIKLSEQGWVHSNYTRDLLGQAQNFKEGAENYLAAPVNMRQVHAESAQGESFDFVRLGVMSDMRNGWVDLATLQNTSDLQKVQQKVKDFVLTKIDRHMKDRMKIFSGLRSSLKELENKNFVTPDFLTIKEMTANHENPVEFLDQFKKIGLLLAEKAIYISDPSLKRAVKKVQIQINELLGDRALQSSLYALQQMDPKNLKQTIQERTQILERQMIQLIQTQVLSDPQRIQELVKTGQPLDLVHVGLLNPNKTDDLHPSGWMHNERTELEDMRAIFNQFSGKKLIFDGTGPLLDGDQVHLPLKLPQIDGQTPQITLNATIFNISPQGNMENTGLQRTINKEALKSIAHHQDLFLDNANLWQHLQIENIPEGEKGYPMAEDLLQSLMQRKGSIFVSVGCAQAKDRTGLVADKVVIRSIVPKQEQQKFIDQILSPGSAAMKIAQKNTLGRLRSLKVNPFASNLTNFSSKLMTQIRLCKGMALDWFAAKISTKELPPMIGKSQVRRWSAPLPVPPPSSPSLNPTSTRRETS